MRITIAQRFQPFSHLPGVMCLLAGTTLRFQIFPTLILVSDLSGADPKALGEIPLPLNAPFDKFTVLQDLEKSKISIYGKAGKVFQRFHLSSDAGELLLLNDKNERIGIPFKVSVNPHPLATERLSLGNHKAQDWCLVKRRNDLAEILPLWLRLGQSLPVQKISTKPSLLLKCLEDKAHQDFLNLFKAGFDGILSPRSQDSQHQGYPVDPIYKGDPLLALLTQGGQAIRSLFIEQQERNISILPHLPQEFHCGRFIGIQLAGIGVLDIEWTKKQIRKMILAPTSNQTVQFDFGKKIKSFRLTQGSQPKGSRLIASSSIDIHTGESYLFDRFEH